ncbi:MAG: DUF362 domain-containing protein [Desulfosarcinaceae bacterium]|nr:DUF362 domain-containing protein [Desulfosarcinaceae bacterium]
MRNSDISKQPVVALNRRGFLKGQIRSAAALLLAAAGVQKPGSLFAAQRPDLVVATGSPARAVKMALAELGGMGQFVKPGQRVVIKPNMSFPHPPERATNTHPEVVRAVVAACKDAGAASVRVLDHPLRSTELCIEGVKKACSVFEEDIVHGVTESKHFKPTGIPDGRIFRETDVLEGVLAADVLIAVPVAKSHGSTGVSLSMKGMMGLIYDRGIMHYRYDLHEAIVDLATLLRPDLVVVDATRVLTSKGPSGNGKVIQPGIIIAGTDMVAADAYTVEAFPWYERRLAARNVKHIRIAHERGLGRMDVDALSIRQVDA